MPSPSLSLRERFDPRRNNLGLQRLLLAGIVLIVHGQALRTGTQPQLLRADIGQMAVDGFFILSGFLVTGSALRLDSVRRFLWHRALRILPGFWVSLVVIAVGIAPVLALLEGRSPLSVFSGADSSLLFVLNNSSLLVRQWNISGMRGSEHHPEVMDGSMWSLFYEALCYLTIAGLIVVGVLVSRPTRVGGRHSDNPLRLVVTHRWVVAGLWAALWLTLVVEKFGPELPAHQHRLMLFMFLIGSLAELYAEYIPMNGRVLTIALVVFGVSCALMLEYQLLGGVAFGYLLLWAAVAAPMLPQPPADLSYGVYLYHWPIFLVLLGLGLGEAGGPVFLLVGSVLTTALGAASWYLVENRALGFKGAGWVQRPPIRTRGLKTPARGLPAKPRPAAAALPPQVSRH